MQHPPFPPLPCFPCPHQSACCAYGTTLSEDEARAIAADHGKEKIFRTCGGERRPRASRRRCVFLPNTPCSIYTQPSLPAMSASLRWVNAESGGPYEFDRTICP